MCDEEPANVELSPDLLRRVLVVFEFDNCDGLFWRVDDGVLSIYVECSDFFGWAIADVEPIETEADVIALEQAKADLIVAEGCRWPMWIAELYAARRRHKRPGVKIDFLPGVKALFDAIEVDE
jgi:hypothetical protein